MNRNLRALRHWLACGLAVFGVGLAWAQMPVPLLDANAQTAAPSAAAQQLESLLQCKAGTVLKTDEVESRLRAIGRKRLAIPPRQTASIHILSSLAHRRFRMRRAPLSTTSAMTVPITKSGYEDPVHATSAPATITPALAITSFAEKI